MAVPLKITRGKTLQKIIRWETTELVFKAITHIANSAPALATAPGHGIPPGWRAGIVSVLGMTEINADDPNNIRDREFHEVTVVDGDKVEIPSINAAGFRPYQSGGYLVYYAPHDLSNRVCRVKFKDRINGNVIMSTEPSDAPNNVVFAILDDTAKTIRITAPASKTASIAIKAGVWEAEVATLDTEPIVEQLIPVSPFVVLQEVVT